MPGACHAAFARTRSRDAGTANALTSSMQTWPILLVAACAAPTTTMPRGGPRGLRASEHLDVARQHDQLGRETVAWPETTSRSPDTRGMPWIRSWDAGAEHERAATAHRSEAAALQAEYDEACGSRAPDDIANSPLVRYGIGRARMSRDGIDGRASRHTCCSRGSRSPRSARSLAR